MPAKKKPANKKSARVVSRSLVPVSLLDRLRKPALLIVIVLAATVGAYFAFFASAASGIPAIVSVATSQIGVAETDGNNAGATCKYQGSGCPQAWCGDFVSWVYQQAGYPFTGGADGGWRIGAAAAIKSWFQAHGSWYARSSSDVPQPGDVVYSINSTSDHVGIVDHVDGTTLYTIDGNSSDSVRRVFYANYRSDTTIIGWGRLNSPLSTSSNNEYFIKTRNTPGSIEVHRATATSNYQTADIHSTTRFSESDAANGTWQMVGPDLYFIQTRNTPDGKVWVRTATAASHYASGIDTTTRFSANDAGNGTWEMVAQDLYFIKTINTGKGTIEVHNASQASKYLQGLPNGGDFTTRFSSTDANNGTWQMVGTDLYFLKTIHTGTGHIELHSATLTSNYGTGIDTATWFSSADAANGTWQMVGPDLYFIKTIDTGTGKVEVHSATTVSKYQSGIHDPSWFSSSDANNGIWEID